MIQGTASSVGKSAIVHGLCRLAARRGIRVAPFKGLNMSNNAGVCLGGGEIGRAQYAQALAAGVEPSVLMNPILLKPQVGLSQVIVLGEARGTTIAADHRGLDVEALWPVVADSLDTLRRQYDLILAEGAGSPAEVNLRSNDLVNMRVALHARADVLIVADIDRGGAFAALLGTWGWLDDVERALVRGFVLNKFRGDAGRLEPAPSLLEGRTGVPVVGVVPYLEDLNLAEEDAANVPRSIPPEPIVEIAVLALPHVSNFDELQRLGSEPGVWLRYAHGPKDLRAPDLVIVPGTKATIPDLLWLHQRGFAERIRWLAKNGTPVLGICGGYQMLGTRVDDPEGVESPATTAPGLRLLDAQTVMGRQKRVRRVAGRWRDVGGFWGALSGAVVTGYEIHAGTTESTDCPLLQVEDGAEGCVDTAGIVAGTSVHGLMKEAESRHRLLAALAVRRGYRWKPSQGDLLADPADRLANILEQALDPAALGLLRRGRAPEVVEGVAGRR